jgi:hypothetical protein
MLDDIIPNHLHADEEKLHEWFGRVFEELEGYNSFPQVTSIVSEALVRYANRETQRTINE